MKTKWIAKTGLRLISILLLCWLPLAQTGAVERDEVILYLNDPVGSAVAAFDESGELCWVENYTPYGDKTVMEDSFLRAGCGTISEERGFTGHTEDFDTDLVYMQQRYFDPTTGRFLSMDPVGPKVGDPRTINRYSYAANNPYKYVDPTGEIFFLAPAVPALAAAATFVAKEVAAEVLSMATGGATDFLSASRMARKGLKAAGKALSKGGKCSFDGSTEVLTDEGYRAIRDIKETNLVWSRDEKTGEFNWELVVDAYSNSYDETVYIDILDTTSSSSHRVISNRIHPFFVKRDDQYPLHKVRNQSSNTNEEGHVYSGMIPNGQWVDAANLISGDKLLNHDGTWSIVAKVEIDNSPLLAYNLDVEGSDSFFVRGAQGSSEKSVWVHNCETGVDVPKGGKNSFPDNPDDLLSELPRDAKGRIYPSDKIRIRPEQHDLKPGEKYAPRHHGQHYHVETRADPNKSWNNKNNVTKIKPDNYQPGHGTGFLPGEKFPGAD